MLQWGRLDREYTKTFVPRGMAQALCRVRISLPKPPIPGVLADKVLTKCVRVTETRQ